MNNMINFFYNINPTNLEQHNNNYYFFYNNNLYILKKYNLNINEINNIYNLNQQMIYNNIPVHQIILNKHNIIISNIEKNNYILLKIIIKNIKKKITLEDINILNNIYINPNNININWSNNWIQRIDYLEYQINQTGKQYPLLVESISYFIGLSENAISYYKKVNNNEIQYSYSHRKLTTNSTLFEKPPEFLILLYSIGEILPCTSLVCRISNSPAKTQLLTNNRTKIKSNFFIF